MSHEAGFYNQEIDKRFIDIHQNVPQGSLQQSNKSWD